MGPTAAAVAALFERNGIRDPAVVDVFSYLLGAQGSRLQSNEDPKAIREKAHRALLRALEAVCRRGPAVVAVEDVHWIDPTSRDLLGEAARIIAKFPVLLVTTSRPSYASEWLDAANPTRLALRPLDSDETRLAIKAKWPEHRLALLPDLFDATERISGGVPLFIEEICQWVSQNVEPDTMRLSESANPSHVSAFESILESRLQQLGTAREVARAAAVAGTQVTLPLLRALLPDFGKSALANAADTLCETGFLTRIRVPGGPPMASGIR